LKYASKRELVRAIEDEHRSLVLLLDSIPTSRHRDEGNWGDGWTINDLLAHLTEWEQMFLRWFREGQAGKRPTLPAPGFKWSETPALNCAIWPKHHGRPTKAIR